MFPALADADVVLVLRKGVPKAGQVVLVTWDGRPGQLSLKRALHELPDGWFVVGDNAGASTDSRQLGAARVHGVVLARLWPQPTRNFS
jgi:hypothetical protein